MKNRISNQTRRKWAKRIAFCWDQQDLLTGWEIGFIESIDKQMDEENDLTLRQSFKLGEIFKRVEEKIG